jgi:hypothetical protein
MRLLRWMAVFVLAAALAWGIGTQSAPPTVSAQDYQVIDRDNGQVEPRLQEPGRGPFPDRPQLVPGPRGPMGPQIMGPAPAAAMWGDDKHIYILRGDEVFKLTKDPLKVVARVRLPGDQPMPPGDRPVIREGEPGPEPDLDRSGQQPEDEQRR